MIKGIRGYKKELGFMSNITTAEFAAELGTDTRTVRKFLRAITPKDEQPGKGSRWVLEGNKRSLTAMRKQFAEWTAAREAAKNEAEVETPTEVEDEIDAQLDD
jgi:predicted transcriptional regulator